MNWILCHPHESISKKTFLFDCWRAEKRCIFSGCSFEPKRKVGKFCCFFNWICMKKEMKWMQQSFKKIWFVLRKNAKQLLKNCSVFLIKSEFSLFIQVELMCNDHYQAFQDHYLRSNDLYRPFNDHYRCNYHFSDKKSEFHTSSHICWIFHFNSIPFQRHFPENECALKKYFIWAVFWGES